MDALSRWLGFAAIALAACDTPKNDLPPPPTTSRSDAVTAKPTATSPPTATHTTAPSSTAPLPPRKPCAGQTERAAPKLVGFKTAAASGAPSLAAPPPIGVGKWTWMNLWAAWCEPCKAEMPRLLAWQKKFEASGAKVDLQFVSLDDDERQLQRLLEAQPKDGVRASFWLPEGEERATFLRGLGAGDRLDLPVHAFFAPSGKLACFVQGAVDDRDYAAIATLVGAKP